MSGKTEIFSLKFAGDAVEIVEDADELTETLRSFEEYAKKNRLTINAPNSKVMVFRNEGKKNKNYN